MLDFARQCQNRMRGLRHMVAALTVLISTLGFAAESDGSTELDQLKQEILSDQEGTSQEEKEALLTLIQLMETDIAIKSQLLDADYSPGLVSLLRGEDLAARGVHTVAEALSLVPGVDIAIDNTGGVAPIVRGAGGVLATFSGKLKFMLNGVNANLTLNAGQTILAIPIEQVERIEIIRGPGSAIYGEYAYSGVINVITRKQGRRIFARYGSFDTLSGGGVFSYASPQDLRLNLNLAGWKTNGGDVQAGEDALFGIGQGSVSYAPGPSNEAQDNLSTVFSLDYRGFSLLAQYSDVGVGDFFGATNALPPPQERIVNTTRTWLLEARQDWTIEPSLHARFKLGWQRFSNAFDDARVSPPGLFGIYPDGVTSSSSYKEKKLYAGMELNWKGWEHHDLLFGVDYSSTEMFDVFAVQNVDPTRTLPGTGFLLPLPEPQRFPGPLATLDDANRRHITGLFFQDHFKISDRFTLTGGLRYDRYSDVGDNLSPRLALIYRFADQHVAKMQYAEAFRPPTFLELYSVVPVARGNRSISPETVQTLELAYIYKTPASVFRATGFYSDLDDLIVTVDQRFINSTGARLKGLELEWERRFGATFKLDANLSYVDTEDKRRGAELQGAANWLANLGLLYQPNRDYSLALQYRYVGKRKRAERDVRDDLSAYQTLDLTGSAFNLLGVERYTLRAGVDNLFDEEVIHPAPPNTYPGDFPRPGRSFWVQLSREF